MPGGDAAAWAQAYLSAAAIIVSGGIAVFVPWNERRLANRRADIARLGIECNRSRQGGLEITISYTPEFRNHSLGATVQLLEPRDARVYKGVMKDTIDQFGDTRRQSAPGPLNENLTYNAVPLLRSSESNQLGEHRGVVFVEYPDERSGPRTAKIRINVLRHGNLRVLERVIRVSPVDDAYYLNGAPIAIITGTKDDF